jgi:hypothetical protein
MIEKQSAGGIRRVNILVDDLKLDALVFQLVSDLAQMQGRSRQSVEPRND